MVFEVEMHHSSKVKKIEKNNSTIEHLIIIKSGNNLLRLPMAHKFCVRFSDNKFPSQLVADH